MNKWIKRVERFQLFVGAGFLAAFVIFVILQVLVRHVPFITIHWTEEAAKYCFIWAVFMGAAVMVGQKEHFALTFIVDKFPQRYAKSVQMFIHALTAFFGMCMVHYGVLLVQSFWGWSLNTLPLLEQQYIWMAIPVSGLTMAVYSVNNLIGSVRNGGES